MIAVSQTYTTDFIIQYSLVGLVLLAAFSWILWKMLGNKKRGSNSCCGCGLADSCKKKNLKDTYENSKNLQRQHSRQSD